MNFCTLFDSNYASKGIALYLSLEQQTDDFVLYVMGMDRKCQEILSSIGFKHMVVECIDDIDSPELAEAKGNRSRAEFCWTCGSFFTDYFLNKYNLPDITYLDSDLMFFSSPKAIFDELITNNASVGLSPHYKHYNATGKYCVQYVYFKNDIDGCAALTWWKDSCLKWCYSQMEDGKYGDQLYLESMPSLFNNVYEIQHRGHGIATWNQMFYKFYDGFLSYKGQNYPYVFFHYSGFNIKLDNKQILIKQNFSVSKETKKYFLQPYIDLLTTVYKDYLHEDVNGVKYVIATSFLKTQLNKISCYLFKYRWWNYMVALIIKIKYNNRHSPYSEKKR